VPIDGTLELLAGWKDCFERERELGGAVGVEVGKAPAGLVDTGKATRGYHHKAAIAGYFWIVIR
jgi:hypothetical protein